MFSFQQGHVFDMAAMLEDLAGQESLACAEICAAPANVFRYAVCKQFRPCIDPVLGEQARAAPHTGFHFLWCIARDPLFHQVGIYL